MESLCLEVASGIIVRLDDKSMLNLCQAGLWHLVLDVVRSSLFWYHRTMELVGKYLLPRRTADWREIYSAILSTKEPDSLNFNQEVLSCLEATQVQIEAGCDPSANNNDAINRASICGYVDTIKLLLLDTRVDPTDSQALESACECCHTEAVKLLLQDGRCDPAAHRSYCLRYACDERIVRLLIEDGRVDSTVESEY